MQLTEFLQKSYTAFQATDNCAQMLLENGFENIQLADGKKIERGGKYFTTINGSAIVAFSVGDGKGLNVACAHTDSPCLKIKGPKLIDSPEGKRINVEVYGGLILSSIMDIPLKIAGRVLIKDGDGLKEVKYVSPFNVNAPSLCIHHSDAKTNELNPQNDLLPLIIDGDDLYSYLGLENVVDADLFVVPDVAPFYSGKDRKLLVSPRIDNLSSVYACIQGIINANPKGISLVACFDNEETGSRTKQGADSAFLERTINKIYCDLGIEESLEKAMSDGFILSVDNGHAVHPAHPEKSDPTNKVTLNGGIVIKHHVNYATDGRSSAILKVVLDKENVPYQDYYNRSDIRCGGTIGLLVSKKFAMDTVDIGLGQLAMHSTLETVGSADLKNMTDCITAYLNCFVAREAEKIIIK